MPGVYFSLFDLKLKVAEITSSRDESSRELWCSVNAKLFFITVITVIIRFPSKEVRRCPSVFITYSTALRLHNLLYGRALAPADL